MGLQVSQAFPFGHFLIGAIHQVLASQLNNSCLETCPGSVIRSFSHKDAFGERQGLHFLWENWRKDPDGKPPSSDFSLLLTGEGNHKDGLPQVTKQVKICLWAFSGHQRSEGPEVRESR